MIKGKNVILTAQDIVVEFDVRELFEVSPSI